jgi:hypothetical protein
MNVVIKEKDKYLIFQYGKAYRLFFWDNGWKAAGKMSAAVNMHEMIFPDVPSNALYVLIPEYSKDKERPFSLNEQGEMLWW